VEPENYKFGGGATETILHPAVLVAMLVAIILIICLPRKHVIIPLLLGVFLTPLGQQVVISGLHVFVIRILILVGCFRLLRSKLSSESPVLAGGWNSIDTAFLLAALFHAIAFIALYAERAAVVNQFGYLWDYLGGYFILRYLIQDEQDVTRAIRCFSFLVAIFAVCMIREQLTGQNIFGVLGGVPLVSEIREGRVRSEAVFQHAILAGTFAATLLPLFGWLWKSGSYRLTAAVGGISSAVMVFTTACSTPLLGLGGGLLGVSFWPLRKRMRWIRWAIALGLLALHFTMHAPVWYVIAHVGVVEGSSSYHRAELVDTFVNHFGEWWLRGAKSNANWGYEMFDTSNQYVHEGVTGGLFALIFFITMIKLSFGRIGTARKAIEGNDGRTEWMFWLLGCALFANVTAYFGISYFDQTKVSWFAFLAMISATTAPLVKMKHVAPKTVEGVKLLTSQFAYQSPLTSGSTAEVTHDKQQRKWKA
jgi:hypothetical protein